nr:hypothetical membrane protein [uncultured archaeon]
MVEFTPIALVWLFIVHILFKLGAMHARLNEEFHHDLWMICRTARAIISPFDTFKVYTFYYIIYKSTNVVFFD